MGWRVHQHMGRKQKNFVDCGMFAIEFIRAIADARMFSFSQRDIPKLREQLALKIEESGVEYARVSAAAACAYAEQL